MTIDTGDTAWLLTSSALVLLMTPGLAFFYGGLVRRKNALATIMQSFIIIGVITVQWALWGYSLAFGPDIAGGLLGNRRLRPDRARAGWTGCVDPRRAGLRRPDLSSFLRHQEQTESR